MARYYPYGTVSRGSQSRSGAAVGYTPKQTPQQLAAAQRDAMLRTPSQAGPPALSPRAVAQSPQQIEALRQQYMSINPDAYAGTPQYDSQLAARNQAYANFGYANAVANPSSWYHTNQRTGDAYALNAYNYQNAQSALNQMQVGHPVTAPMINAINADPATLQQYLYQQSWQPQYGQVPRGTGGSWQAAALGDDTAWMSNPAYAPMR